MLGKPCPICHDRGLIENDGPPATGIGDIYDRMSPCPSDTCRCENTITMRREFEAHRVEMEQRAAGTYHERTRDEIYGRRKRD